VFGSIYPQVSTEALHIYPWFHRQGLSLVPDLNECLTRFNGKQLALTYLKICHCYCLAHQWCFFSKACL